MSDNPLDRIPSFDRVSIRAVVVSDGEDPSHALAEAGIFDPISLPVVFGENQPDFRFGDGITPNLTAVLESDQEVDEFDSTDQLAGIQSGQPRVNPLSKPVPPPRRCQPPTEHNRSHRFAHAAAKPAQFLKRRNKVWTSVAEPPPTAGRHRQKSRPPKMNAMLSDYRLLLPNSGAVNLQLLTTVLGNPA
jgi:hypothetical protein